MLIYLFVALVLPVVRGAPESDAIPALELTEPEVFGADTPLGRLSYQVGRGLRLGKTGLVLGGFATAQLENLEGGSESDDNQTRGELEGLNLFVFYDPLPFAHLFSEIELGPLLELESGEEARSNPDLDVDRLYLDLGTSDALSARLGKFLTPVGRRNTVSAEPLTWTTSEPLIVEEVFDETTTGAMLFGSTFPPGGALSYSLYGTFLDPIDGDPDAPPADHTAGAHLEWASFGDWTAGVSYFGSEIDAGEWNHLGGVDLLWQHERVEVSGEAVFGEGGREDGALWGAYLEGAVETVPTLYAVGRYERFDPPGEVQAIDLFDLGLAWVPRSYLRLKADYQFGDQVDDVSEPGFRMSLSILF